MKKIILVIIFISITTVQLFAQRNDMNRIKAFKTAYITDALDLSASEAEKFWPVYNEFSKTIQQVKNRKTREIAQQMRLKGGVDNLTENEASVLIKEFLAIDANVLEAKRVLFKKLDGVISPKKIIKLFKAEQDFNKELLKRFRDREENRNRKN
jgi:hypothetical protein